MTGVSAAESSTTGRRTTRQRTAVSAVLDEIDEFRSSQEIHDLLRRRGDSIGLTTVYRALQALADDGVSTRCAARTARPSTAAAARGTTTTWSAASAG
jgi:Fe2+ or Zn2+ uptake regulation protein